MRDCVKRSRTKKSSKLQLHRFSEAAFALQLMKSECLSRQALYLILMRKILSKYEGQEIEFVISEFNPRRNRVIGDRRQLLVAERAEKQKELFARLTGRRQSRRN